MRRSRDEHHQEVWNRRQRQCSGPLPAGIKQSRIPAIISISISINKQLTIQTTHSHFQTTSTRFFQSQKLPLQPIKMQFIATIAAVIAVVAASPAPATPTPPAPFLAIPSCGYELIDPAIQASGCQFTGKFLHPLLASEDTTDC